MKKVWIGIVVIVVLVASGWWYSTSRGARMTEDPFLRTAVVKRGDLVVSISASGLIEPVEKVEVKSKASGEIIDLPIEEGDYVHKGDLIARLDPNIAQNSYDQAKADHSVAEVTLSQRKKELARQRTLFEKNLTSESVLDDARLAYEQANAQLVRTRSALSIARERLDDTEIRAPISGVILSRPVESGQIISSGTTTVTGGTPLCSIANMSQVYVVADVDETDIGKVQVDQAAMISADAFPDQKLEGHVLRIAPLAKEQQNVTMFEVTTLVDNTDGRLKAGMNATVEVVMDRADDAILIPVRAVVMKPPPTRADLSDSGSGSPRNPLDVGQDRQEEHAGHGQGGSPHAGQGAGGHMAGGGDGGPHGRMGRMIPSVQVKVNGVTQWVPVRTGLSNLDAVEILHGLAEGDTVVYSIASGAMRSREAFRERMRSRSSMSGMRR